MNIITATELVEIEGSINPVVLYDGVFVTETQWWGQYFSLLEIEKTGEVSIAGTDIEYTYDHSTQTLSFDWHEIKTTQAKGKVVLFGLDEDRKGFYGSINPRPQDGPVGYEGAEY